MTNLRLSGAVIAGIFTNQITMWNDPRIAADNPGLTLPATPTVPVVRTDGAGSTWQLTQWMLATQTSYWSAYCAVVGRNPCTPTSTYPVQPGTAMVSQPADTGVAGRLRPGLSAAIIGSFHMLIRLVKMPAMTAPDSRRLVTCWPPMCRL